MENTSTAVYDEQVKSVLDSVYLQNEQIIQGITTTNNFIEYFYSLVWWVAVLTGCILFLFLVLKPIWNLILKN